MSREPLTPTDVRRLLDRHGLAPRKSSGQNFVVDPNTVRRIVEASGVGPDDTVLEIGPGLGSLTIPLLDAARRVVAIEVDAGLVRVLEELLGDEPGFSLVHADAMRIDLAAAVDGGPAKLVANLPYNVATPLVMQALEAGPAITEQYVMVQREVGERWSARVGQPLYSAVSVKVALTAEAAVDLQVPRSVFHPVPNVDSVMVRIRRRDDAPSAEVRSRLAAVVDTAFAQRRKTLRNTLRALAPAELLADAFASAGIDPGARAETLTPEDFVRLTAALDAEA
ncbi:MAG: 16S rRNA (adenine(1518)-N(6)/adenine(1519)-N(6))-dimethyltransferase RsmA [Actinobacteria bacterium]|nr:16S rRNA (adenine(1518)-N(6)/adenine(1519)-N(6))-dimethyltransferase RsmA [Actinomycetota bacterium]